MKGMPESTGTGFLHCKMSAPARRHQNWNLAAPSSVVVSRRHEKPPSRGEEIMKKTVLIFAATILLWATSAGADEVMRSFRQQIPVGSAEGITLDFPVGEVTVEAWDCSQVDST
jgi:hypothetical protein